MEALSRHCMEDIHPNSDNLSRRKKCERSDEITTNSAPIGVYRARSLQDLDRYNNKAIPAHDNDRLHECVCRKIAELAENRDRHTCPPLRGLEVGNALTSKGPSGDSKDPSS